MKVLGLAADNGGCGFYRLRAPAAEVASLGVDITVREDLEVDSSVDMSTGLYTVNQIYTDADLIIFQRPLSNAMHAVLQQAKKQGIATIVELDDDFSSVHPSNISYRFMEARKDQGHNWVSKAAAAADHITVSTTSLLKFAPDKRGSVLPNYMPESIFDLERPAVESRTRLGWTGSVQTHPTDLQTTRGVVGEIAGRYGMDFNVVGDGASVKEFLRLPEETNFYASGWVDVDEFYPHISELIDIGIVPLEDSNFNRSKSWLKGLEFAALGIPFVASSTIEYEKLASHGIGKTAKSPGDWRRALTRIIERTSETERLAEESRDRIKAEFTYKANAPKWIEAWEKAIDYRKTHLP